MPRVDFRQHTLERGIFLFNRIHGGIHTGADSGLPGVRDQMRPARFGGNKEHVFRLVFILVFRIGSGEIAFTGFEPGVQFLERIGNVFEEHQSEHDMLVFRRVDVFA